MNQKRSNIVTRGIFKAIGLFGGSQVAYILCAIIRTKLIAVWIGPVGVGLSGLFNSVIDIFNQTSNLGIRSSSVRDISVADSTGMKERIARVVRIVRRWCWVLGLIWAFIMLVGSPVLSRMTFGNSDHVWDFMALSVCIMAASIINCEQAVLQGTRKLKNLATAMTLGTVVGLLITIPMYYFWRIDSIVPSLITYFVSECVFILIFRNKDFDGDRTSLTIRETVSGGVDFVKMGICITASTFITLLVSYVFMAYLNHSAGTEQVGLYQAGNSLVNRYATLMLSSIGYEYYPRLASVCESKIRTSIFVIQESNIMLYLLVPVIVLFLLLRDPIVGLLYSSEFKEMIPFVSWCMVGLIFKGVSWCVAYVILARGDSRIYLLTESLSAAICLALNIWFYEMWGLDGLGISYALWYFLYLVIVCAVYFRRYGLKLHRSVGAHVAYAIVASGVALWACECGNYVVAILLAIATLAFSGIKIRKSVA